MSDKEKLGPVAVMGCGRLGSAMATLIMAQHDELVVYDIDPKKEIALLERRVQFPDEPYVQFCLTSNAAAKCNVRLGHEAMSLESCQAAFIIVNTPSVTRNIGDGREVGSFDCRAVIDACDCAGLPRNCLRVVVSTVTRDFANVIRDMPWRDRVVYCPAFVAQGSVIKDFVRERRVIVGSDHWTRELVDEVSPVLQLVWHEFYEQNLLTLQEAILAKLAINAYLAMKISFANAISMHCREMGEGSGLRPDHILAAVGSDKRIGESFMKPGGTFGGPCLPRDTKAIITQGNLRHLLGEPMSWCDGVNERLVISVAGAALNAAANWGDIGVLGLAYKPGVDMPGVPSFGRAVLHELSTRLASARVKGYDPVTREGSIEALSCDVYVLGLPRTSFPEDVRAMIDKREAEGKRFVIDVWEGR